MKSFTTKWMIAAAALVVAAGTASAQVAIANVPFSFRAGNTVMAAGTYRVDMDGPGGLLWIRGEDSRYKAFVMPAARIEGGTPGDAKLVFECGIGRCALIQAWSGVPGRALQFNRPNLGKDEAGYLSVIHLRLDK
jgi:hypothetical protein